MGVFAGEVDTDWGGAILVRHRTEYDYCGCGHCEGHERQIPLPESEWYWRPAVMRVDMGAMPRLEPDEGALFSFLSRLGKP